jgi:hypothetical protein
MAISDFRFKRHMRLWEEQNKLVKLTIIVAILIGLLLPIKVLKPMTEVSRKIENAQKELKPFQEKKEQIGVQELVLDNMEKTFSKIPSTLAREPWMDEMDKLIRTYQDMRRVRTQVSGEEIQAEADKTIRTIGGMIRERIIGPLEESLPRGLEIREAFQVLSGKIETLNGDIEQWEADHIGNVWYQTILEKIGASDELKENLRERMRDLPGLLQAEQEKIDEQRDDLTIRTVALEKDIDEKKKNLDDLERQMQQILPGWLRGIVGISEMIQIFPAFLLVLTLYIFWLAISLTRHYNLVVGKIDLTQEDKKDPSTSSTWTLTNRGQVGTLITVTVYLIFTILMWGFFEWGYKLLNTWMTDDNCAWYGKMVGSDGFLWFSRMILVACLVLIVFRKTLFERLSESLKTFLSRKPAD